MSEEPRPAARLPAWPLVLAGLHAALHAALGLRGWLQPLELFTLLLLAANLAIAMALRRFSGDRLLGAAVMVLIAAHALVGQRMAPDALTSGALLMVNILTVYSGYHIFGRLGLRHGLVFAASYFVLFYVFVVRMSHGEPIFLLALMGLCATARDYRLLAYFWCLVLSFTACQPFAWEAAALSFVFLAAVFSARGRLPSTAARAFLAAGLAVLLAVLLPVAVLALSQAPQSLFTVAAEPEVREAIALTAVSATVSTAILLAFGVPLAYGLSRLEFRGKALVLSLIDVPIVIPQSVAGIALLVVFGRRQVLGGALFELFGLRFDGALAGICLAQVFVALPFLVKPAMAAFDAVPARLELAARHLGANSWQTFAHLALPIAGRGLFAAALLCWARAAGEFGAVYFMTAAPAVAPIAVFNRFERAGLAETAPMVTLIVLLSLGVFLLLQLAVRSLAPAPHEGGAPS